MANNLQATQFNPRPAIAAAEKSNEDSVQRQALTPKEAEIRAEFEEKQARAGTVKFNAERKLKTLAEDKKSWNAALSKNPNLTEDVEMWMSRVSEIEQECHHRIERWSKVEEKARVSMEKKLRKLGAPVYEEKDGGEVGSCVLEYTAGHMEADHDETPALLEEDPDAWMKEFIDLDGLASD